MSTKKTCGVKTSKGDLVQFQVRPEEGWTVARNGSFICNIKKGHRLPHIQSGNGLVSWPWEDLGNGWGKWANVEGFAALWGTPNPPWSVEDVVGRLNP